MYNDELDYALESAYEDGYRQALADMGYEFDDAEEDVDMFDADYFNEAMEGNPVNKAKKNAYMLQTSRKRGYPEKDYNRSVEDLNKFERPSTMKRPYATNDVRLMRERALNRPRVEVDRPYKYSPRVNAYKYDKHQSSINTSGSIPYKN